MKYTFINNNISYMCNVVNSIQVMLTECDEYPKDELAVIHDLNIHVNDKRMYICGFSIPSHNDSHHETRKEMTLFITNEIKNWMVRGGVIDLAYIAEQAIVKSIGSISDDEL